MSSASREPAKNVLTDVWLVSVLATKLVREVLQDSPMSVDEFALYGLIADLATVTASDLARGTGMPPTTLSTLLRRCEDRGEIERVVNPDDGRSGLLMLTEHGRDVYLQAVEPLVAVLEELREDLGGRLPEVRRGLEVLDSALRTVLNVDRRPYTLDHADDPASIAYNGPRLSQAQQAEVRNYVEWVRERDR